MGDCPQASMGTCAGWKETKMSRDEVNVLIVGALFIALLLLAYHMPKPENPGPLTPPESLYTPSSR